MILWSVVDACITKYICLQKEHKAGLRSTDGRSEGNQSKSDLLLAIRDDNLVAVFNLLVRNLDSSITIDSLLMTRLLYRGRPVLQSPLYTATKNPTLFAFLVCILVYYKKISMKGRKLTLYGDDNGHDNVIRDTIINIYDRVLQSLSLYDTLSIGVNKI